MTCHRTTGFICLLKLPFPRLFAPTIVTPYLNIRYIIFIPPHPYFSHVDMIRGQHQLSTYCSRALTLRPASRSSPRSRQAISEHRKPYIYPSLVNEALNYFARIFQERRNGREATVVRLGAMRSLIYIRRREKSNAWRLYLNYHLQYLRDEIISPFASRDTIYRLYGSTTMPQSLSNQPHNPNN